MPSQKHSRASRFPVPGPKVALAIGCQIPHPSRRHAFILLLMVGLAWAFGRVPASLHADDYFVATTGSDANDGSFGHPFRTIQHALDTATSPGDRILVRQGVYNEKIQFVASGNRRDGHITLRNYPDEIPILDGTGVDGQNMVLIRDLHHIRFMGFEIRNNLNVTDGSGVRVEGTGRDLVIRDLEIHDMRGTNAMGITVYGTSPTTAILRLSILNNHVHDCEPAPSEAIVVNGNVARFTIANNRVHDVNNIGIDAIGGETEINSDPTKVARTGIIRDNVVYRARSVYGGGFGAGIYVDGGFNLRIDGNEVFECDMGIEIGAENSGIVTRNVIVRNNLLHHNDKAGLAIGGYDSNTGRVRRCRFLNNTLYRNDFLEEGYGQIWIQYATKNIIANNIVWGSNSTVLLNGEANGTNNVLNYNLWYHEDGPDAIEFVYEGQSYTQFSDYQLQTGQDANSLFADPQFSNVLASDFSLQATSPAVDAGTDRNGWYGLLDYFDQPRPQGTTVDMGAIEYVQTGQIQIHISNAPPYNVFEPQQPFTVDVTPELVGGIAPPNLACYWVDFQGRRLSDSIALELGQSTTIPSPSSSPDVGYYGLKFVGNGTTFNPQTSQMSEIGFCVLPSIDNRTVSGDSPLGLVHLDPADPFIDPGHAKTTASAQAYDPVTGQVDAVYWRSLIDQMTAAGQVETPIVTDPPWTSDDTTDIPAAQLSELQQMMQQYFTADTRVVTWELGLEENLDYDPDVDLKYFDNLAAKFQAVRDAVPPGETRQLVYQFVTVDPTSPPDQQFLQILLNSPAADQFDVFSVHPYDWNQFRSPELWLPALMTDLRTSLAASGHADLPIWFTEVGAPQNDAGVADFGYPADGNLVRGQTRSEHADFLVKLHALALAADVQRIYWYNYIDQLDVPSVTDPEDHFGLRDHWGFPKPVYAAYAQLVHQLRDTTFLDSERTNDGVQIYRFENDRRRIAVAWCDSGQIRYPSVALLLGGAAADATPTNVVGSPLPIRTDGTIRLESSPVWVEAPR